MSGGMWDYLSFQLQERAEITRMAANALDFLAALEHEMDWGASGDTCYACACNRVVEALREYFNCEGRNIDTACALARDDEQNRCETCQKREIERRANRT